MKTFNDLEFIKLDDHRHGIMARIKFGNGYGASVVRHQFSYGHELDLYELAVLDGDGCLHYDNPVADGDVVGWLSEDDVTKYLIEIQNF